MVHIKCKRTLNIPLEGRFSESETSSCECPLVGLDLSPFTEHLRVKPHKKEGDTVLAGEPIAYDVHNEKRQFTAPTSGVVRSLIRGSKRRILTITIEKDQGIENYSYDPLDKDCTSDTVIEALFARGLSPYIWQRPFNAPIHQEHLPKSIFVSAIYSEPFAPDAHLLLSGNEELFQLGITYLSKIAPVHLVHNNEAFANFQDCTVHTISGHHPIQNHSIHIAAIDPISHRQDIRWTLKFEGVRTIGSMLGTGLLPTERKIALSGEGIKKEHRKLVRAKPGISLHSLIEDKKEDIPFRLITGSPLTGKDHLEFLGFEDVSVCALCTETKSHLLRFFRPGFNIYTATRTYLSCLKKGTTSFDTNRSGDIRAFVDKNIYQKVMPLKIPVETFLKALMTDDKEMAEKLGILQVAEEDFALTEFICPSKIPHMKIVKEALLHAYQEQLEEQW